MDYLTTDDTIVAIASARGAGRRGVVRLSGPAVTKILNLAFVPNDTAIQISQVTAAQRIEGEIAVPHLGRADDMATATVALPVTLLYWPDERSYTRQKSAEFHTFGSQPLLALVLNRLCRAGARLALPGEFTLRAFLSGRMDLTQAEAVLALIDADSRKKLDTAIEQLSGGLAGPLAETRRQLIGVLAELEAGLDFVEEDIEFISNDQIVNQLQNALAQIASVVGQINDRQQLQTTPKVSLTGLPNAGKSSLLNALTGEQNSIVTPIAGTTTDRVSAPIAINGLNIEISDTAGIENVQSVPNDAKDCGDPTSAIMKSATQIQAKSVQDSDLVLLCLAPETLLSSHGALLKEQIATLQAHNKPVLIVATKSDLTEASDGSSNGAATESNNMKSDQALESPWASFGDWQNISAQPPISVSSVTGAGLSRLKFEVAQLIAQQSNQESSVVESTLLRTQESLIRAKAAVTEALTAAQEQIGDEIIAAEVRESLDALGQIVGTIYTDDILDLVFGRFCIGK